jgi:hypothetical protein
LLLYLVTKERKIKFTEKPCIHVFSTEDMTVLTPGEPNLYRHMFLGALYKLAKGLMDKPVDVDKVFKETNIGSVILILLQVECHNDFIDDCRIKNA